ncbi:hypothetical protein ACOCEA_03320 [Maribacter sp. CXY002]|uniref:hypothetical protein n=1 Tax=Maribacter luteocoastalis TaxID=3407671 RepID=UPI003B671056
MLKFNKKKIPDYNFKQAVKKPIPVRCIQIDEPFMVETLEGEMHGKAGDWLIVGISGEMYPIDRVIFEKTYTLKSNKKSE